MTTVAKTWDDLQAAVRSLTRGARVWILVGTAAIGVAIAIMAPVAVQDEAYHDFASSRLFDIENFGIVASNATFLIVGVWGLWLICGRKLSRPLFDAPGERWPYVAFFAGVVLVTFGSGYYHWDPTTDELLWDRLAMTVIFMALFAAFITDRIHRGVGVAVMLPALLILGAASMAYWRFTGDWCATGDMRQFAGHWCFTSDLRLFTDDLRLFTGDLRLYRIVEVLPIVLILMMCLLFRGRLTRLKYVLWMGFWFGLATAFELLDEQIYDWIKIGGHTIKHPTAAIACYVVIAMLRDAARHDADGDRGES